MGNSDTQITEAGVKQTPTGGREKIIPFVRRRDYIYEKDLGQGACGKTVLLFDPTIDERFVCKKYAPKVTDKAHPLFANFLREIKLLFQLHHPSIVRVFNWFVYPEVPAGFILMEYVDGVHIDIAIRQRPELAESIFEQVVDAFSYLESKGILHRDIRPQNVMVCDDGSVKLIDFGFGKKILIADDLEKSIELNWWCEIPLDFKNGVYDFCTEVYFVGQLFKSLLADNSLSEFKYDELIDKMCERSPEARASSFSSLSSEIRTARPETLKFSSNEKSRYQNFADLFCGMLVKLEKSAKILDDIPQIERKLTTVNRESMLEGHLQHIPSLINCFIDGNYYFSPRPVSMQVFTNFFTLFVEAPLEKKNIIIANLHTRLKKIERYAAPISEDDIPF